MSHPTSSYNIDTTLPLPHCRDTSVRIPVLGLGVCGAANARASSVAALKTGYRHLDTAQIYQNEKETGQAVQQFLDSDKSSVPRSAIFVCSKLWEHDLDTSASNYTRQAAAAGVRKSLRTLGTEYIDLYLLHTPRPGSKARIEAWLGLQDCLEHGLIRCIGVSNWAPKHIEALKTTQGVTVIPAVNQIEFHCWNQQRELLRYCKENKIVVVAYSPLTQGKRLGDSVIKDIAQKHSKTPAQVVLRWCLQMGVVVIPKSDREERVKENAQLFGWELDEEDMSKIEKLDEGQKGNTGEWDPYAWE